MLQRSTSSPTRARRGLLGRAAAAVVLSGGVVAGLAVPAQAAVPAGSTVVSTAAQYAGTPYRYGGTTPAGFDCSGLTQYVYARLGVQLPRTAEAQHAATRAVPAAQAVPGDLVFFLSGSRAYHAGIYAGGGYVYDAPRAGRTVGLHKIWTSSVAYGRVLG